MLIEINCRQNCKFRNDIFISFEAEYIFEIRVYKEWEDQLRDETSKKFKELSTLLKKEVSILNIIRLFFFLISPL